MKINNENYAFRDYFDNQVRRFEENCIEISNSLSFNNYFCDSFCSECVFMYECEVYEEIGDEWEGFYA